MGEYGSLILSTGIALAIVEGIKSAVGWGVKRYASKKDKREEKQEASIESQIKEIKKNIGVIEERINGIDSSLEVQKETSKFILYDRLRYLAKCFVAEGAVSFEDRDTWNAMQDCYHTNGGNGTLKPLAETVNSLPLKH